MLHRALDFNGFFGTLYANGTSINGSLTTTVVGSSCIANKTAECISLMYLAQMFCLIIGIILCWIN